MLWNNFFSTFFSEQLLISLILSILNCGVISRVFLTKQQELHVKSKEKNLKKKKNKQIQETKETSSSEHFEFTF